MASIPKISFPVPANGRGKDFGSAEELLRVLAEESSGLYLVGTQGMWHGGIHIMDEITIRLLLKIQEVSGVSHYP